MRRQDYYRPNDNSNSREDYQRGNYQQQPRQPEQGPSYNNYNYGPQQPPYYPPRRHHHVFMWILIIILCLGLGWFAADHFIGGDSAAQQPQTVSHTTYKTTNNSTTKPQVTPSKQPNVNKIQNEMTRLGVTQKDQMAAFNFYTKQNAQNQQRIMKMIGWINTFIPSDAMKRQALNWVFHIINNN